MAELKLSGKLPKGQGRMMRTWSIEEVFVKAYSAGAVAVQGVIDVFTHRPGYANAHPIPGCPKPSDCREYGCAGNCSEAMEADDAAQLLAEICRAHRLERCSVCDEDNDDLWVHPRDVEAEEEVADPAECPTGYYFANQAEFAAHRYTDDDTPNPTEPSLSDDELVGMWGLLQERYAFRSGVWCTLCNAPQPGPHRDCCPKLFPEPAADCGLGSPPAAAAGLSPSEDAGTPPPPSEGCPVVKNGLGAGWPKVMGHCPACQCTSLFLGSGGRVTCACRTCANPCAADELLDPPPPSEDIEIGW